MELRRAGLLAVLGAGTYLALTAPWPGLEAAHARWFRSLSRGVVKLVGCQGAARVAPASATDPRGDEEDTSILVGVRGEGGWYVLRSVPVDSWSTGLVPLATFAAVAVAGRAAGVGGAAALALGALATLAFVALRVALLTLRACWRPGTVLLEPAGLVYEPPLAALEPLGEPLVALLVPTLHQPPLCLLVPVGIWAVAARPWRRAAPLAGPGTAG